MKRLFFGPTNSTGIFHHEVTKAFAGLEGCVTIHDNLLVYGRDVTEHNRNMERMLKRAKERGIMLKLAKSTICAAEIQWFGRTFSGAGISADPEKIQHIQKAGKPENIEEVKSLLQAAGYNAKFAFDYNGDQSFEEATAPLRELLEKGALFKWGKRQEESFHAVINMMSDESVLAPYNPRKKTHFMSDASPIGIAASLYQENEKGQWLPVDHISRALSKQEQNWRSQID